MRLERKKQLLKLCEKLNIDFDDISLLDTALTHTSYAYESKNQPFHNERLEFLGDAVLELSVSSYIYLTFPDMSEGDMTKLRASVVCEAALVDFAKKNDIGECILLGKGEKLSGGKKRDSILADAVEAIIGAYYIDKGFSKADNFVLFLTKDEIDKATISENVYDYKTKLQEVIQKDNTAIIRYELLKDTGPDHQKTFFVAVLLNEKVIGKGQGKSKKEAEQTAAKNFLLEKKLL